MANVIFNNMKLGDTDFKEFGTKSYLPDALYGGMCSEYTQDCKVCSNSIYSPVVQSVVHDTLAGKVFCPFGTGNSMNQPIYGDQLVVNTHLVNNNPMYSMSTWGHVPQLAPRSLTRVGQTWRTS